MNKKPDRLQPRTYQSKNKRVPYRQDPVSNTDTDTNTISSTDADTDADMSVDQIIVLNTARYQPMSDALILPSPEKPQSRIAYSDYVYGISPRRSSLRWQRELRVQLRTFKGRTMIHIREWFSPQLKREAWRAGVGISFPPYIDMLDGLVYPTLDTVIDALCRIRDDINSGVIVIDPDLVGVDGVEEAKAAYDQAVKSTERNGSGV